MKRVNLSESQHLGLDNIEETEASIRASREVIRRRFLQACLLELGGSLAEPWQFDQAGRFFWMKEPNDNPGIPGEPQPSNDQ